MNKIQRTKENLMKCLCKNCPTYSFACKLMGTPGNIILFFDTMNDDRLHAETMFCAYDKSQCINEEKGCKCSNCEVYKENRLDTIYFCTNTGGK